MNEENKNQFLKDFRKADIEKKLDMWYYAVDQSGVWEELLEEMSAIAEEQNMSQVVKQMKKTIEK